MENNKSKAEVAEVTRVTGVTGAVGTGASGRSHAWYVASVRPHLKQLLQLENDMQVPRLAKVVLNIGLKRADTKMVQLVEQTLQAIAGQKPQRTKARLSIASFKLRKGMIVGVCVTLRRKKMYDFLEKLIHLSLPKVRDFQGVSTSLDGNGNYNLGVKDWSIFPEADDVAEVSGINVTFHTTARLNAQGGERDRYGFELLKALGMPFKKQ